MSFKSFRDNTLYAARMLPTRFTTQVDDWYPMLILQLAPPAAPEPIFIPPSLGSVETKNQLIEEFVPGKIREYKARGFAMLLSSWAIEATDQELLNKVAGKLISLSQHPNRKEVLTVYVADRRNRELYVADIIRHQNAPPTLGKFRSMSSMHMRYDGALKALDEVHDKT